MNIKSTGTNNQPASVDWCGQGGQCFRIKSCSVKSLTRFRLSKKQDGIGCVLGRKLGERAKWKERLAWDRREEIKRDDSVSVEERTGKEKRTSGRKWEQRHWRLRCYQVLLLIWQSRSSLTEAAVPLHGTAWASIVSQGFVLNNICNCQQSVFGFSGLYPSSKVL